MIEIKQAAFFAIILALLESIKFLVKVISNKKSVLTTVEGEQLKSLYDWHNITNPETGTKIWYMPSSMDYQQKLLNHIQTSQINQERIISSMEHFSDNQERIVRILDRISDKLK